MVRVLTSKHGIPMVQVNVDDQVWGRFPNMDLAIDHACSMLVPPHQVSNEIEESQTVVAASVLSALVTQHSRLGLHGDTLRRCMSTSGGTLSA